MTTSREDNLLRNQYLSIYLDNRDKFSDAQRYRVMSTKTLKDRIEMIKIVLNEVGVQVE